MRRLTSLKKGIAAHDAQTSNARLYDLFAECRFGFEQAQRIWADNEQARRGLERVLEVMAGFELNQGDEKAAGLLIAQLEEKPAALLKRLEALQKERKEEDAEFESLKRIRHAVDVRVGARQRGWFAMVMGVAIAIIPLVQVRMLSSGATDPWPVYLWVLVVLGVLMAGGVFSVRRYLVANQATLRIVMCIFVGVLSLQLLRMGAWAMEVPYLTTLGLEHLVSASIAAQMATFVDRRIFISSLGFVANAAAVLVLRSETALYFCALGNLWVFWFIGIVWLRDARRAQEGPGKPS